MAFMTVEEAYRRLHLDPPYNVDRLTRSVFNGPKSIDFDPYRQIGSTTYLAVNIFLHMAHVCITLGHRGKSRVIYLNVIPLRPSRLNAEHLSEMLSKMATPLGFQYRGADVYSMFGSKVKFRVEVYRNFISDSVWECHIPLPGNGLYLPSVKIHTYNAIKADIVRHNQLYVHEDRTRAELILKSAQGQKSLDMRYLVHSVVMHYEEGYARVCDTAGSTLFRMPLGNVEAFLETIPVEVKELSHMDKPVMIHAG